MSQFSDLQVNIKFKLSALWASTMFLYIYCDYFELYTPGKLESMINGDLAPLGTVSQGILMGMSVLMLIPSLMIFLSIGLPARYNRILNIIVASFFTLLLALLTYMAGWYFYKMFAAIETVLTMIIVWYAWNWPENTEANYLV